MGSPTHYACYKKEMIGWIREKMAIQESAPKGGRFFAFNSIDSCATGRDCLIAIGNDSWDNACTFYSSSKSERLGRKPSTLVQHAQRTSGSSDG